MCQFREVQCRMVSIIPGWIYSLFAAIVVGAIVVASISLVTVNVRNEAQTQELANIDEYVASQSLSLVTHATQSNQNSTQVINLPTSIGNQIYWVYLGNDSSSSYVESGFGTTAVPSQPQVYIPAQIAASGAFISGYGRAVLQCTTENHTVTLTLTSE